MCICFVCLKHRIRNSFQTVDMPPERCKEKIMLSNTIFIMLRIFIRDEFFNAKNN